MKAVIEWLCIALAAATAAAGPDTPAPPAPDKVPGPPIVVQGKVFCPLKRAVAFPFDGTVVELPVDVGQPLKAGDVLARYRLAPDTLAQLRRRLAEFNPAPLETELAGVEEKLLLADTDRRAAEQLTAASLAPALQRERAERRVRFLTRQRDALREQIERTRQLAEADRALLAAQLNAPVSWDSVPEQASLTAPIDGTLVSLDRDLAVGAEVLRQKPVMLVGIMDPMLIRAPVHESEAVRIHPHDLAQATMASVPGRTYQAAVSRVGWCISSLESVEMPSYYEVELTVTNRDLTLRDGFKAEVTFRKTP